MIHRDFSVSSASGLLRWESNGIMKLLEEVLGGKFSQEPSRTGFHVFWIPANKKINQSGGLKLL